MSIYIYIWGICVCLGMGSQGRDFIFGIFKAVPECPENFSLYTLARRPHRELCPRKPARSEEKDEDSWLVKYETPRRSVRSRKAVSVEQRASKLRVRPRSGQSGAEKQSVRSRRASKLGVRSRSGQSKAEK